MQKTVSENWLIEELKDTIENSDWDQLSAIAEFVFGGKFTYDADIDMAILTPDENYSGTFGELDWEIEASFYDVDEDTSTPYAQKIYTVSAVDVSEALDMAKELAEEDDEADRADNLSIDVEFVG